MMILVVLYRRLIVMNGMFYIDLLSRVENKEKEEWAISLSKTL